jgi:hypothetical protein
LGQERRSPDRRVPEFVCIRVHSWFLVRAEAEFGVPEDLGSTEFRPTDRKGILTAKYANDTKVEEKDSVPVISPFPTFPSAPLRLDRIENLSQRLHRAVSIRVPRGLGPSRSGVRRSNVFRAHLNIF